jgi:hypothetical protein
MIDSPFLDVPQICLGEYSDSPNGFCRSSNDRERGKRIVVFSIIACSASRSVRLPWRLLDLLANTSE